MKASAKTEAAVTELFDKYLKYYRSRDLEGLMALMIPEDDLILYGTGADEKRIGPDGTRIQAKRDWSQTDSLEFKFTWRQVSEAGPVAWVSADGEGEGKAGGQTFTFPFRMTAVLEKRGEQWYIAQTHISLPSAAQEEGDSVPV